MIRTIITKFGFVRTALAVGVAIPFLAGSSAFAQDPSPAPADAGGQPNAIGQAGLEGANAGTGVSGATAETERIIVTGSYIPTAQEVGPNPVLNINRDLINKSGSRTAEELIKDLPVANGGGVPISNNATGFTPGATAISLRGLGPQETLVLINGRRIAPFPVGNGGTSSFFDLRSIPEAAIESIEVLKDGASTTYGADAVAGVVNVKLRRDYKGAQAQIGYGNTTNDDSGEIRANVIFGVGDGNTNISGVMNYYKRNSIFNHDRSYSAVPPFLSTNSTPENLQVTFDSVVAAGGTPPAGFGPVGNPDGLPSVFFAHAPFGSNGSSPASAYTYSAGRSSLFNFNAFSSSFPDIEEYGGYVTFDHKAYGDAMVVYGDLYYENTSTHNELAAGATGSFLTPGSVTLAIPPSTPNPGGDATPTGLGGPTYAETGVAPGAFNPFNPFNQILSGGSRARLFEFGNRLFDNSTDAFLTTLGIRGDKLFDGTWGYDAGWRYSKVQTTGTSSQTSTSRWNQIVNQASPVFQPGGALAGGTAFNPFGDALTGGTIASNVADVNFAVVHPKDVDTSELSTLDFNMYTTSLFKLPAGGVGFAYGAQFRKEQLNQVVDQINIDADVPGNSPIASTAAGRKDWAVYAETTIPVTSPTWNAPGFYSVEISAGGRYENFENNNTHVAVPKVGLRWQPFDETFTLRGTWGQGFREPSLIELYASPTSGLTPANDPLPFSLGGPPTPVGDPSRFNSETPTVVTSSPVLTPENSASFNVGFVWTPKFVNGLTIEVDGWQVQNMGTVVESTPSVVLNHELNNTLLPGEIVQRDAGGNITRIFTPFVNAGSIKTNGVDFGIQYVLPTKYGTFTSLTNGTYVNSYQFELMPGAGVHDVVGNSTAQFLSNDGYLRWKGVSRLDWTLGGWDMIWTARYFDGFHEFTSGGRPHYSSQSWWFDVQLSYDFTYVAPVENQPVAGYSKDAKDVTTGKDGKATEPAPAQTVSVGLPIWKRVLNGTQLTIGCNDVFNQTPPKAYGFSGNSTGYAGFLFDSTDRFVYFRITKKF